MEENESGYQMFPSYTMRSANSPRLLLVFVLIFILVIAIFGGLFMFGASQKKSNVVLPTPTIAPTATPLPTSSTSAVLTPSLTRALSPKVGLSVQDKSTNLDRSKLRVIVLNGSGEKGVARQLSSYLESIGYQIVQVGNADAFTYRNVSVQVKSSKSAYASLLKKDLQTNPAFASVSASISDAISSDAEVIVGK